jgi:hypothetical protein
MSRMRREFTGVAKVMNCVPPGLAAGRVVRGLQAAAALPGAARWNIVPGSA